MSGQFVALFGSADRYLARIAALSGENALAERYFGTALDMDRRTGSLAHVAETLARQAVFLAGCGRAEEARRFADEAAAIAEPIHRTPRRRHRDGLPHPARRHRRCRHPLWWVRAVWAAAAISVISGITVAACMYETHPRPSLPR